METPDKLKELVREKYGEIAEGASCGCSTTCCGVVETSALDFTIFAEDYSKLEGYHAAADLTLGCGIPTEYAAISPGDVVLDLGSGAGNDAFVARLLTGSAGRVIGLDMTPQMVEKARANAKSLGIENVEFRLGDIEAMPVTENSVDVVISNCVLNLVPDKEKAFREIFRVLKPGGHFSISDVVLAAPLPKALERAAEMYAGCVSGASLKGDYLSIIGKQGFSGVKIQEEKTIALPADVLEKYLGPDSKKEFEKQGSVILSVTVYGEKPRSGR